MDSPARSAMSASAVASPALGTAAALKLQPPRAASSGEHNSAAAQNILIPRAVLSASRGESLPLGQSFYRASAGPSWLLWGAGELPSRRKASKRQTSRVEETAATNQAAAIAAVAASSGATYLDAAARSTDHPIAPQQPSGSDVKGVAQGPSIVSRSFLDPLGVFEKVSA